jgi:hypothetical protein
MRKHNESQSFGFKKSIYFAALLYLIAWFFFASKKMDFILFPYNDMFSGQSISSDTLCHYGLKQNGILVSITDKPYWKKDLLEQSIKNYALFLQHQNAQYSDVFFTTRKEKYPFLNPIYNKLKTPNFKFEDWTVWYLKQSGNKANKLDYLELMKYKWYNHQSEIRLLDSLVIKSTTL